MSARPVNLASLGVVSALGRGKAEVFQNLMGGLRPNITQRDDLLVGGEPAFVGQVPGKLPDIPDVLSSFASRNLQISIAAADEIKADIDAALSRFGADRVAVVLGTSTSGIAVGEAAVRLQKTTGAPPADFDIRRQETGSVAEALARYLGVQGLAYTVSTACSSGLQALAAGRRLIEAGLAEAVVAGAADSLCRLTVNGFRSLSALSQTICNPMSRNRDGITVGEGAAMFLMLPGDGEVLLRGVGSENEACSMTAPDPSGAGVEAAMRRALADAGIGADEVDYIQLHGTGTQQNDVVESLGVMQVFGAETASSSSKGQIGHTLGAAGAMAAAHCWLAASAFNGDGLLPPHLWDGEADEGLLSGSLVVPGQRMDGLQRRLFLANAFAFGGSNMSVVIGRG